MVLEIPPDTRQVHKRLDARGAQFLTIANPRALQNEWRGERSAADDDLFAGAEDSAHGFAAVEGFCGHSYDAYGAPVFD
jgi:hypothetical protein